MVRFRFLSMAAGAVLVSAVLGGIFGRGVLATQERQPDYRVFTAALNAIDTCYIDKVESDRLVYSAIGGMARRGGCSATGGTARRTPGRRVPVAPTSSASG